MSNGWPHYRVAFLWPDTSCKTQTYLDRFLLANFSSVVPTHGTESFIDGLHIKLPVLLSHMFKQILPGNLSLALKVDQFKLILDFLFAISMDAGVLLVK
jgi:hypothetical protein